MPVFIDQTWDPRMVNKHIILISPGPLPSYINKKKLYFIADESVKTMFRT